jgi:hypothetical protein
LFLSQPVHNAKRTQEKKKKERKKERTTSNAMTIKKKVQ